jgi:hypothetical protein
MRLLQERFNQLPLRAHSLLTGVPLRTLYRLDLPGGRQAMTLPEIQDVLGFKGGDDNEAGRVTRALFWLRGLIGRLLRWDEAPELAEAHTYLTRLSEADRARSLVTPGAPAGISRVLYSFEHEFLAEIINRTVHCFWLIAAQPSAAGYTLYFAVYVKKLNWFTPIYMALITPLLKGVIYPAMLKSCRRHWERAFPVSVGRHDITGQPVAGS